jgi:hypothetical protein
MRSKKKHEEYGSGYGPLRDFLHAALRPLKFQVKNIDGYIQRTFDDRKKRAEAREFLKREVKDGPVSLAALEQRAADANIPIEFLRWAVLALELPIKQIDRVLCYCPPDKRYRIEINRAAFKHST